jgi:hypothetical protein
MFALEECNAFAFRIFLDCSILEDISPAILQTFAHYLRTDKA